ncbi:hypothetical protein Tco_1068063 [Tanacetum coccineum]|uniref:Uncharacterized protein n=1 Tax=Tanacetum coccineum TaxID=301880 RepID=A0ABQ5HEP0_9ASTR
MKNIFGFVDEIPLDNDIIRIKTLVLSSKQGSFITYLGKEDLLETSPNKLQSCLRSHAIRASQNRKEVQRDESKGDYVVYAFSSKMDGVLFQAQEMLGTLMFQRSTFGGINSKLTNVGSRLPTDGDDPETFFDTRAECSYHAYLRLQTPMILTRLYTSLTTGQTLDNSNGC